MPRIQEWIYQVEVGSGVKYVRATALLLGLVMLIVLYNVRAFQNFSTPAAMDQAQLARNLAQGEGFTTQFIRPLSLHLLEEHREDDFRVLEDRHPDITNAPLYPLLLAGVMKVAPFEFGLDDPDRFSQTWRYQPEVLIAGLNQALLLAGALTLFLLGRRLFDSTVAWIATLLFLGSDLLWRFSVSGESTLLLILLFLGIVWCLVVLDEAAQKEGGQNPGEGSIPEGAATETGVASAPLEERGAHKGTGWYFGIAVLTGLLVGLGALTRYSFGWLILPVILFPLFFLPKRKGVVVFGMVLAFALALGPWVYRNYAISGAPFGTAAYALFEGTQTFPSDSLPRSLSPNLNRVGFNEIGRKLVDHLSPLVEQEIPALGGSLIAGFFFVSLLIPFRNGTLRRLRGFSLLALALLAVVQALGQTYVSEGSGSVHSDNLLVLLLPLVFLFAVALFLVLLDQFELPEGPWRSTVIGVFVVIMCAPLILTLLPPRTVALAYPPYNPYVIHRAGSFMETDELIMSDIPWAVAWYGDRQSVWLTRDINHGFYEISDFRKPISALYLSPMTMDSPVLSELIKAEPEWGKFVLEVLSRKEIPDGFPLKAHPTGLLPDHLFLADRDRW